MRATILPAMAVWAVLTPSVGAVEAFKGRVAQSTEAERSWAREKAFVMVAALRAGRRPERKCGVELCTETWVGLDDAGWRVEAVEVLHRATNQIERATCQYNVEVTSKFCKLYDVNGVVDTVIFDKMNGGLWNERKN